MPYFSTLQKVSVLCRISASTKIIPLYLDDDVLHCIEHFVSYRLEYTSIHINNSTLTSLAFEVHQSSATGPLRFLIYTKDRSHCVPSNNISFVDSFIVSRSTSNCLDDSRLQNDRHAIIT